MVTKVTLFHPKVLSQRTYCIFCCWLLHKGKALTSKLKQTRIWKKHCSVGTPAVSLQIGGTIQVDQSKLGLFSPLSCFACSILYTDRFSCAFFWMHIKGTHAVLQSVDKKTKKETRTTSSQMCCTTISMCMYVYKQPMSSGNFSYNMGILICIKYAIQNNIHIKHDSRSIDWKIRVYIYNHIYVYVV